MKISKGGCHNRFWKTSRTREDDLDEGRGNGEKDANGIIRLTYELVEGNTYYIQSESESAGALGSYTFYIEQPFDIVIE